jgi:outer membrane protein assembly factor BamB
MFTPLLVSACESSWMRVVEVQIQFKPPASLVNQYVFIGSASGNLYALNGATG